MVERRAKVREYKLRHCQRPACQQCRTRVPVDVWKQFSGGRASTVAMLMEGREVCHRYCHLMAGLEVCLLSRTPTVGPTLKRTEALGYNQLPPRRILEETCLRLRLVRRFCGTSQARLYETAPMKVTLMHTQRRS